MRARFVQPALAIPCGIRKSPTVIPSAFARNVACLGAILWIVAGVNSFASLPDWGTKNYFIEAQAGLEQNPITAVMQSRDGYLWIGTYTGLLRFDGVHFTVFNPGNSRGLRNGRIIELFEDDLGAVWIGHETGEVTELKNGVFTPVQFKPSRPDASLIDMNTDARGDVWILHGNGSLYRLSDGLVLGNQPSKSKAVAAVLARNDHGELWVAANGTVSQVQNDQLVPFKFDDGEQTNFYSTILPSHDGGLWTVRNGVLQKWRDGKWVAILGAPWGADAPLSLVERRSGMLVVGTLKNGLFLLKPGFEPLQFSRGNGLSHDWVRSLCEDREGNIWIGTGGGGLNVLRERRARILNPPDHWQGRTLLATFIHGNEAWVGTEGAGLYKYDLLEKTWQNFGETDGLTNSFIWSVLQTSRDKLFVGTWDSGIFERGARNAERRNNSALPVPSSAFHKPDALAEISAPVTAFYEALDGSVWIGAGVGLHHYQDGKLIGFVGNDKLVLPDVRAITQSADGTIWFGMVGGGLGRLQNGAVKQFQKRDGLGSDFVQCLLAEEKTIWIGTGDNGICRFKNEQFVTINSDMGLPNNVLCSLVDDGLGNFWLGTHRGISRVSKSELEDCANGRIKEVHCLTFGSSDGLPSEICSGGFQPNYAKTPDGSIWFPTAKGIVVVDPAEIKTNHWPPAVVIENFVVEGQPTGNKTNYLIGTSPPEKPLRILPGKQRFEVHYSALSFAAPSKVRFKYKLEKIESDWVDAGENRSVQFSYLPPDEYNFRVIACNNDGLWNETGASLAFTVLPYFWQTLWFRITTIAGGATLIGFTVLWITRRRLKQKMELIQRQRAIERERSRIARDIHDDLGASLTRITMLSESMRGELSGRVAENAEQVYRTARETTRALDEIVWAVNPKHDTLDSLASYLGRYAQSFLAAAQIRCRLDVPVHMPAWSLSAEIRHNVFLAFKEALNNVVKHAAASEVKTSMQLLPNGFLLCVADDGRGFNIHKSREGTVTSVSENGGNGIANMQKRLAEIGGSCEWTSERGAQYAERGNNSLNAERRMRNAENSAFPVPRSAFKGTVVQICVLLGTKMVRRQN